MTTQIIKVPFHDAELFIIEHEGQPFTPMKPIVDGIGLRWQGQHEKLNANPERWGIKIIVIPSAGGPQEMLCIPLRKLPGWLMSIQHRKVRPELRDKIIMYQNECDDVLWDYWTKGNAANNEPATPFMFSNPFDSIDPALLKQLSKIGNGLPWAYLISKGVTPDLVLNLLTNNRMTNPLPQSDMFTGTQA
jgi:hypothetical protein